MASRKRGRSNSGIGFAAGPAGGAAGGSGSAGAGPRRYTKQQWKNFRNRMGYYGWHTARFPEQSYIRYHQRDANSAMLYGPSMAAATADQQRNRRKHFMVGRGIYQAGMVGRGNYMKTFRRGAKKVSSFARKHQGLAREIGMIVNPEATIATEAYLKRTGMGTRLGNLIEGRGRYNSLFGNQASMPLQEYDSVEMEHGNLVVKGMEKVTDLFGNDFNISGDSTSGVKPFTTFHIDLTPGNFQHFPKLAQHAANFQEYAYISLVFCYKSTLSQNWQTNNVTTGKVIMATEHNLKNSPWTTAGQLRRQENHVEGPVTGVTEDDRVHYLGVECDPTKLTTRELKFVKTHGLTPDEDAGDYLLGRTSFGMFNTDEDLANKMIGELWATYEVHFKNHRQFTSLGYGIPQSIYYNSFPAGATVAATTTALTAGAPGAGAAGAVWISNGSNDPKPIWENIFKFDKETTSRKLCYSNIDFLIEPTAAHKLPALTGKRFDGVNVKLTFPSSLRGNYEVELQVNHYDGLPNNSGEDPDVNEKDARAGLASVIDPQVTGTCILNYDWPIMRESAQGLTDGTKYLLEQSATEINLGGLRTTIRCHIHLEQATATVDNTLTLFVPMLMRDSTAGEPATLNQTSNSNQGLVQYLSTMVSVKQYNSFQKLGTEGFEWEDAVTGLEVTS
jgi:hypothetical protein